MMTYSEALATTGLITDEQIEAVRTEFVRLCREEMARHGTVIEFREWIDLEHRRLVAEGVIRCDQVPDMVVAIVSVPTSQTEQPLKWQRPPAGDRRPSDEHGRRLRTEG